MKDHKDFKIIEVPVIKEIKTKGILDPDNIIGYEPEPFLEEPKYKDRFAVVHLKIFDSFLNLSMDPRVNSITIEIKTMFSDNDELLIVDKEGRGIVGMGFLKDSKTLLLKHRFHSQELSIKFADIMFMAKVRSASINSYIKLSNEE
jgi:hypothetical protein